MAKVTFDLDDTDAIRLDNEAGDKGLARSPYVASTIAQRHDKVINLRVVAHPDMTALQLTS